MKKNKMLAVIGIIICLAGTILMVETRNLGERTTAVAIVLLITGICAISISGGLFKQEKPLTQKQQRIIYGMVILLVIAVVVTALSVFV